MWRMVEECSFEKVKEYLMLYFLFVSIPLSIQPPRTTVHLIQFSPSVLGGTYVLAIHPPITVTLTAHDIVVY